MRTPDVTGSDLSPVHSMLSLLNSQTKVNWLLPAPKTSTKTGAVKMTNAYFQKVLQTSHNKRLDFVHENTEDFPQDSLLE